MICSAPSGQVEDSGSKRQKWQGNLRPHPRPPKLDGEGCDGAKCRHMRMYLLPLVACVAFSAALAGPNDIDLVGLVDVSDPEKPVARNDDFRALARELGVVFTPSELQPAETTGISGFDFALTYTFHPIDLDKPYWQDALEEKGTRLPMTIGASARKGFVLPIPLASEVEFGAQYLIESQMLNMGAKVRMAINEGFTGNHWWVIIPDIAVMTGINRVVGSDDLDLLTVTAGGSISKSFGVFGSFNLTPFIGYQNIFVNASTRIVDADPTQIENVEDNVVFTPVLLIQNRIGRISGGIRIIVANVALSGGVDVNMLDETTNIYQFGLRIGVYF